MAFGVIARLAAPLILDKITGGKDDDKPKDAPGGIASTFTGSLGGSILSLITAKQNGGEKDGPGAQAGF